jgi:hypothetical protein
MPQSLRSPDVINILRFSPYLIENILGLHYKYVIYGNKNCLPENNMKHIWMHYVGKMEFSDIEATGLQSGRA